jgi:hypothetical protein
MSGKILTCDFFPCGGHAQVVYKVFPDERAYSSSDQQRPCVYNLMSDDGGEKDWEARVGRIHDALGRKFYSPKSQYFPLVRVLLCDKSGNKFEELARFNA